MPQSSSPETGAVHIPRKTTPANLDSAGDDSPNMATGTDPGPATDTSSNSLIPIITLAFGSVTYEMEEAVLRLRCRTLISRIDACIQGVAPSRRIQLPASNPQLTLALLETILTGIYNLPSLSALRANKLKPSHATFHICVYRLLTHFDVPGGPDLAANNFLKLTRGINHVPSFMRLARELYTISSPNDWRMKEILLTQALPLFGAIFASEDFDDLADESDVFWDDMVSVSEAVWPCETREGEPFVEPRGRPTIRSL